MNSEASISDTILKISKTAIEHNLAYYKSLIKNDCGVMAMVKAEAYGNGSVELSQFLESKNLVEYLGVAYTKEGVDLRKNGVELPILILNPSINSIELIINECLEAEIHSFPLLEKFIETAKALKLKQPYPIHLKFNTGMNRLGFDLNEVDEVLKIMQSQDSVFMQSAFTHLSSTDMEQEDEFTLKQLKDFELIKEQLQPIAHSTTFYHCLNTNGIVRFAAHQYDMVRLGIGLYGASALAGSQEKLKRVCRLQTKVAAVRKVEKGASISYMRSGRAKQATQIATLSIGYADGFNRMLSKGNWEVEIKGKLYPIIGNICMDLSMVDVGMDDIKIGDEVIIFGGMKSVHDFAAAQNTITYEVLTNLSQRIDRLLVDQF